MGKDARARVKKSFLFLLLIILLLGLPPAEGAVKDKTSGEGRGVPILLYHRFGPVVADSMTVTTAVFESNLRYLKDNGYTVIPLRQLVDYCLGKTVLPPPAKAVVIVEDDAHKSVYSDMLPLVRKYHIPVTVFVYPSAVSHASYTMTWDQLRDLKKTGLFDLQGHTYWHPNFKRDKKGLSPSEYDKFVDMQLKKSKRKLEKELGVKIDMLAWPFGIYDDFLTHKAAEAGYIAAFSLERRPAGPSDKIEALPRYLMVNQDSGKRFAEIVAGRAR